MKVFKRLLNKYSQSSRSLGFFSKQLIIKIKSNHFCKYKLSNNSENRIYIWDPKLNTIIPL